MSSPISIINIRGPHVENNFLGTYFPIHQQLTTTSHDLSNTFVMFPIKQNSVVTIDVDN